VKEGISICIVTCNTLFYNRLAVKMIREMTKSMPYEILVYDNGSQDGSVEWLSDQEDVFVLRGSGNSLVHGQGLDVLVRLANREVVCTLDSDAFPISEDWLRPVSWLSEKVAVSGLEWFLAGGGGSYIHPSYLFGRTEWLREGTFVHNWGAVQYDTGHLITKMAFDHGLEIRGCKYEMYEVLPGCIKPCNYGGFVWHSWYSTRVVVQNGFRDQPPKEYHSEMQKMLRAKYSLDF